MKEGFQWFIMRVVSGVCSASFEIYAASHLRKVLLFAWYLFSLFTLREESHGGSEGMHYRVVCSSDVVYCMIICGCASLFLCEGV